MDMKEERTPRKLLPIGVRKFTILDCVESKSKQGNLMFIVSILDQETKYIDKLYLVGEPKKRWMLKQLLTACGLSAGQDGNYDWDIADILNKEFYGEIEHEDNTFIDKKNVEVKIKQHKIVNIEAVSWDE
jgi:hypothetical protein